MRVNRQAAELSSSERPEAHSARAYLPSPPPRQLPAVVLGASFAPTEGIRCTALGRVRGAGAFTTVPVRLEVVDRLSLNPVLTGGTVEITRDQFWTAISEEFVAASDDLVVRVTLLGQGGGANVYVDDIEVRCGV